MISEGDDGTVADSLACQRDNVLADNTSEELMVFRRKLQEHQVRSLLKNTIADIPDSRLQKQ